MDFRILGSLRALDGAREISLGGSKQKALLAILLLNANQVVSIDRLIDELWGENPPASAANVVQVYASKLRKAFQENSDALETRRPGYMVSVSADQIDAHRFARLASAGRTLLARGDAQSALSTLGEALDLWHGSPLVDFAFEPFAQQEIQRLNELHLSAIEDRYDAEVLLGRGPELVADLERLVAENPLRERFRAHLMRALYRAGRQAQALSVYQDAHRALSEELGIDPSEELQELERMILRHDTALVSDVRERITTATIDIPDTDRSILVVPRDLSHMDTLVGVAESLAHSTPPYEVLLTRLLGPWERVAGPADEEALRTASSGLSLHADTLAGRGVACRVAAFTSQEPGEDFGRLCSDQPVALLLIDGDIDVFDPSAAIGLARVSEHVACDIAVLLGADRMSAADPGPVVALFGGGDHEWSALQLAAMLAKTRSASLRVIGSAADLNSGKRDASRLLGTASLVIQRMTRVIADPVLVDPSVGVLEALDDAGIIVFGLSERWLNEGLGELRTSIVERAKAPVLALRRGPQSTAPAPRANQTRFAWSRTPGTQQS